MKLKLNLAEVLKQYRLFSVSEQILNAYTDSMESISNIKADYPELSELLSGTDLDIDSSIANLIYSYRGKYRSIAYLSELLGVQIELYHDTQLLTTDNPTFPVTVTKVNLPEEVSLSMYSTLKNNLLDVIKGLVWYLSPDSEFLIDSIKMEVTFNYTGTTIYRVNSIQHHIYGS